MAKIRIHRSRSYAIEDDDGNTFAVSQEPTDCVDPVVVKLPDGRTVVGYASQDSDTECPVKQYGSKSHYEPDGSGMIYRFYGGSAEKQAGLLELNYDADNEELQEGEDYVAANPYAVLLNCREHGLVNWNVVADPYTAEDYRRAVGVWVPDESCLDYIESNSIKGLLPKGCSVDYKSKYNPDGTCITRPCKEGERSCFQNPDGTPQNTVPDERFNNVITVTYPDGTEQAPFKSFREGYESAAQHLHIEINEEAQKIGRRAVAVQCAGQSLEEYAKWCNGECYGHVVEVFDANGDLIEDLTDSCWGYIGSEYAGERVKEETQAMVNHLKQIQHKLLAASRGALDPRAPRKRKILRGLYKPQNS